MHCIASEMTDNMSCRMLKLTNSLAVSVFVVITERKNTCVKNVM